MDHFDQYYEKDLVAGCLRLDRRYQEELYQKYTKKMYGICLGYTADRDAAQDMLQEGFMKVFSRLKSFEGEGSLEGWVRKVITNTAIDHFRKNARLNRLIDQNVEVSNTPTDELLGMITFEELLIFLKKLPEGARTIFNLYTVEGYSHKEIALKLEISEGTSKSQLNRARNLLQGRINSTE